MLYERPKHGKLLMYFGVITRLAKERHGLSAHDLEMLLFLYGFQSFRRSDFQQFRKAIPFNVKRFTILLQNGYINKIERYRINKRKKTPEFIYELSSSTETIIGTIYRQMFGNMNIMSEYQASQFKKNKEIAIGKREASHKKAIASGIVKRMNDESKALRASTDKDWLAKIGQLD